MLWFGLKKRIDVLERELSAKQITFGKNKKTVLVYGSRLAPLVEYFGARLVKLEGGLHLVSFKCNKCGHIYCIDKDFGKSANLRCNKCGEGILEEDGVAIS